MTNQCNIEVVEDSSGSDSEVEALLMGKSANKFAANFPSPTVISNVVRNMWNVSTSAISRERNLCESSENVISRFDACVKQKLREWHFSLFFMILGEKLDFSG